MGNVEMEIQEDVAVLRLNRGVTNPINLDFVQNISENIQKIRNDQKNKGLVITGTNEKFFSIGFDLPELYKQNLEDVTRFYKAYNQLCLDIYTLPKPTITAITGHAIAGGCILAQCTDYRYIAEGRKLMGVNEIKLGLPVPYIADRIIHQLCGTRYATEILLTGEFYQPDKLLEMGMVDLVLPIEQVLPKSIEKVELLGEMPIRAFEIIKNNRIEDVRAIVQTNQEEQERLFLDCWFKNETRKLLAEAVKKF